MARKKQLNPMATALTLAALGITGFVIYKFIIKPRIDRKKDLSINFNTEQQNSDILDAQFEEIT
jgi:hypothetical protein